MPAVQGKHWVFTLNNYDQDDVDRLDATGTELVPDTIVYLVFARETGEEGTPHLQGFVSFKRRRTHRFVCELLTGTPGTGGIFVERAEGSPEQAAEYCKKADTAAEDIFEHGRCPGGRGARTDLARAYGAIRDGASFRELCELQPAVGIRYGSGIMRLINLQSRVKPSMEIHVFWGSTGVGKTRRVYDFVDAEKIWSCPGKTGGRVWFDGYDGHEVALFDDFDGSWFPVTYFLKLIDRYPLRCEVKGGYMHWIPKHLFITSNIEPKLWYSGATETHQAAVMRKLNEFGTILECTADNSPY